MVFPQHLADDSGGFFIGRVGAVAHVQHGVKDAAVDRFQAVAHIRQGARDDDAHGVIQIGGAHLAVDIHMLQVSGAVILRHFGEFGFFAHSSS